MSGRPSHDGAAEQETTADLQQYVAFEVGNRLYCLEITTVREIRQWSPTTELPNQPHYGRGVLDIRGEVIPIHDLRARFGDPIADVTDNHVVLIVSIDDRRMGILVDSVSGIIDVSDPDLRPVPDGARLEEHGAITNLVMSGEEKMIALLDLSALFEPDDAAIA